MSYFRYEYKEKPKSSEGRHYIYVNLWVGVQLIAVKLPSALPVINDFSSYTYLFAFYIINFFISVNASYFFKGVLKSTPMMLGGNREK